ncbi:ABC transporter permease [Deinococcus altitudinis]|uniref:ABC transporter permease n=1 Tax=Deinococcus altitudinis TaxID=468914 RepID=UPI003891F387
MSSFQVRGAPIRSRVSPAALGTSLLAVAALLPLVAVLLRGAPAVPQVLAGDLDVVWTTIWLVLVGTLLSTTIGGGLALLSWLVRLPRWADALLAGGYLVPPFIGATAWLAALGPGNVLTGQPLFPVYSAGGVLLAWTTHYAPLAYLLLRATLSTQGDLPTLAARIHGLSLPRALWRVTLPLAARGIGAAVTLVALSLLGNYGVPAVLGFPAKLYTLATLAYARLLNPSLGDPLAAASGVAWLLVVLAIPALWRRADDAGDAAGTAVPLPVPWALRGLAWTAVWLWTGLAVALPLLALMVLAFRPAYTQGFTLANFQALFALDSARRGLVNSVGLALGTALSCALLGLGLARAGQGSRLAGLALRLLNLPYLLPGTLLALGLILTLGRTPLYATPLFLMLAYLLRFTAPGLENAQAALTSGVAQLEFAAQVHGVPRWRRFWRVTLPLLRPQLVASFLVVYPLVLSEVTLSALLYAPGSETAGVNVLNLLSEGNLRGAAAMAVILLVLGLPTLLVPRGQRA